MELLKGAPVSATIREWAAEEIKQLQGSVPKLAIIRVGEKPDDMSYERSAVKKMETFGLRVQTFVFPKDISDEDFKEAFQKINKDQDVAGILLLRPLPGQIKEKEIEAMIDPKKDLDGISPVNIAKVFSGDSSGFAPCTAEAVIEILKANNISIEGKRAAVIGRSMVIGKPLSMLLLKENATVTICHTRTKELPEICRQAEILVAAAGKAGMVEESWVSDGAVVIDVGINVDENGKLCGDVDQASMESRNLLLTPVPGGVGAVTTAVLAKHLIQAARSNVLQ
nr:bifunctional 5,10-methylenetetrahydrofolate dehydrogenase/5,10-methenyltetrahydrofolate cyclohydrolase [uncultured Enterocloster sp.]